MATYQFDTPEDLLDEVVRVFSPREMAEYLYSKANQYSLDLQWDLDTMRLDALYEGFETFEYYNESQLEMFPTP